MPRGRSAAASTARSRWMPVARTRAARRSGASPGSASSRGVYLNAGTQGVCAWSITD